MRWKRKLALTILAAAASAISGSEIAKKRFSNGKGEAYRKFLDKGIHYKDRTSAEVDDGQQGKADLTAKEPSEAEQIDAGQEVVQTAEEKTAE